MLRNSRGHKVTRTLHIACSRLDARGKQLDHRMGSDQIAQLGDRGLGTGEVARSRKRRRQTIARAGLAGETARLDLFLEQSQRLLWQIPVLP